MQTLGSFFGDLRTRQSLDMSDVSRRCNLDRSTISNIERDRPIRWETVHLALTRGLGVTVDSEAYFRCHNLWLDARATISIQPIGHGSKTISKHAAEAAAKFRRLIRDASPAVAKAAFMAAKKAVDETSRKR